MRRTRFMSLLFLLLSLAFFCVPEFRQGLQAQRFVFEDWTLLQRAGRLSDRTLEEMWRDAEQELDARTLAFVALHTDNEQERFRRASHVAALDAGLTWIFWNPGPHRSRDPKLEQEKLARLQAWDKDNAVPFLSEAERIFETKRLDKHALPTAMPKLAEETEWRRVMARAFSMPRYDSYVKQRFELERTVLRQHGLDKPAVVLASAAAYPIPNLLNVRQYGRLLVFLGKQAEEAGRPQEALGSYWAAAHFGERMQLQSPVLIEKLIGANLQKDAYDRLASILRQMGRADEAAVLDYQLQRIRQDREIWAGKDPLAQSSNYQWSVLTVHFFGALVVVFGAFTALTIVYVNAKRWVRPEKRGRLYQLLTVGENYAPILLFFACLAMYTSYYPYAQNYRYYMSAGGEVHDFEPLFYNVFPSFGAMPRRTQLPLGNPFGTYLWYALGGLVLVLVLAPLFRRRAPAAPATGTPGAASGPG